MEFTVDAEVSGARRGRTARSGLVGAGAIRRRPAVPELHLIRDTVLRAECHPTLDGATSTWAECRLQGIEVVEWRVSPAALQWLGRGAGGNFDGMAGGLHFAVRGSIPLGNLQMFGVPVLVDESLSTAPEVQL
jgi:hypothetical protein